MQREDSDVVQLVIVDADDSGPLWLPLFATSLNSLLLGMENVDFGNLLWVAWEPFRVVFEVKGLLI